MFTELLPLLKERDVSISLRLGQDGLVFIAVKPTPKESDPKGLSDVACLPFQGRFTAEQLDARFAPTLAEWVASRAIVVTDLDAALKDSKVAQDKAAAAAREATKPKGKTVASTTVKPQVVTAPQPSLLDTPATPASLAAPTLMASVPADHPLDADEEDDGDGEYGGEAPAATPLANAASIAPLPPVVPKAAVVPAVTESLF